MGASYVPYPEYKESGVEWLDVIPRDWVVSRVKYLAPFQVGWTPPTKVDANFIGDNLWANISDLKGKYIKRTAKNISDEAAKAASMDISPKGSLLYSFKLSVGAVSFASQDMYTNEAIASFLEGGSLPLSYLYYALPKFVIENASTNIYGARILNQELINGAFLLAPSYEEAEKIANFLDHETAKIDTLIEKQQQLIALLKEKRQAVISHAVTKGLHPDAPMRDSGVEWLGEVPEHWGVWKFGHFAPIVTCGIASTPTYVDAEYGIPFLSAQNIQSNKLSLHKYNYIPHELHNQLTQYRKPERGDVLVTRVGAGIGAACVIDIDMEFSIYVSLTHIRLNPKIANNKFIVYFFASEYCQYLNHQGTVTGGGVGNLNVQNVVKYPVALPSIKEQNVIVDYLDAIDEKYNELISVSMNSIVLAKERRTALISAAVTGKIDVRNWSAV
jgi:type I restriction enzyme S subunit